jgi:hypothetical protein
MKKNNICSYLDYVHISDVLSDIDGEIILKSDVAWTRITAKNKITYTTDGVDADAGTIKKDVVTLPGDVQESISFLNSKRYYIIRLTIDDEIVTVGSTEYPAVKNYSDNKIRSTITFTRLSPL